MFSIVCTRLAMCKLHAVLVTMTSIVASEWADLSKANSFVCMAAVWSPEDSQVPVAFTLIVLCSAAPA